MSMMRTTIIPIDQVVALEASATNNAHRINIFDTDSTAKCLLDCLTAKTKYGLTSHRVTNGAAKREKRRGFVAFAKDNIQMQRQALEASERMPSSALKMKRNHFTLNELEASFKNGCGSCQFFFALLDGFFSARLDSHRHSVEIQWVGYSFDLQVRAKVTGQSWMFQFFSPIGARSIIQGMHSANLLSGDTSSTLSMERAHGWIHNCAKSHQHCGEGRNVPLPKRVLDLEVLIDLHGRHGVKLLDTDSKQGTYICLSHCWGKDPMPIRTTMATLNDHAQFIQYSSLPKTFQDAIEITRRLGVRYLWIDSLCIIQDSPLDWQIESSKMADIYQNSYITIAAVSSSDFRGGCFSSDTTGDMCMELEENGKTTVIAVRECKGTGQLRSQEDTFKAFPLLSRAWVYQERMLSRRVLYCNQNELQLECREGLVCECGSHSLAPHPRPKTQASRGLREFKRQYAEAFKKYGVRGQYSAYELCQHWQRTVVQYSRLQLTQLSDKLPALSGCARDIGRLTGDTYLAGLWRASLAEGMLWTVNPPVEYARPATWRAPSRSWASVDVVSGIDYTYVLKTRFRQDFQAKIESAECSISGADVTGEVSAGYIRVRSRLCPVYLRRFCRSCAGARGGKAKYTIEHGRRRGGQTVKDFEPCRFKEKGLELEGADLKLFPDFKYDDRVDFAFFSAEDGRACKLAPVSLLHLYDGQSFGSPIVTDYFVVVRRASVREKPGDDIFERTALVTISFESWARRDTWFESVYHKLLMKETVVEIV